MHARTGAARRIAAMSCALALLAPLAAAHAQDHGGMKMSSATPAGAKAPMFNLGKWHRTITTSSAEAQRYFDQGLNLAYGFNHAQAESAFVQAARLDPNCAMAYWGRALVLGPNINMPMDTTAMAPAYQAAQKAVALSPKATPAERALIQALAMRYDVPGNPHPATRGALDSLYADAMRGVWKAAPNDADVGTLFAESLMDLNPWNFWSNDGKEAPGTAEIVSTLEAVLKFAPEHPGANHYYIHAVEASPHPELAVPSAERLYRMVPEAGHLVHMPGHIWHRVGNYNMSEKVNVDAARVDSVYVAKYNPQTIYPMMYYPHNVHFIWSSACFAGREGAAMAAAKRLEPRVPLEVVRQMPVVEFATPTTIYTLVRFGRWADMLKQPAPPADLRFTTGMWHFGRGMAYAATGKLAEAQAENDSVAAIAKATPAEAMVSFNSSAALLRLADQSLAGEIAAKQGKTNDAVNHFHTAIKEEDGLHYDEPPPWFMPVRQQLGAVLLAAGRAPEAEAAYREDLKQYPENGWSLYGLAKALRARKADAEAAQVEARFAKAWARSDVKLTASRF
jgi:tetratricopeptide (TPR) repeat protein